jgi:hypothetical protein
MRLMGGWNHFYPSFVNKFRHNFGRIEEEIGDVFGILKKCIFCVKNTVGITFFVWLIKW